MIKIVAVIFTLAILASSSSRMAFQLGNNLAALTPSGSRYNGAVTLACQGAQGNYRFAFSNLPNGWTAEGNTLNIPNIINVIGTYLIRARVTDQAGNVLEGNINLVINGVNVIVQSANSNTDNNIQFSVNSGVTGGSPNGGAPSSSSNGGVNAGSPNSGAPRNGGTSGSNPDVLSLYQNYPGLPTGSNVLPSNGGRFPTPGNPTGNPATPNIVPSVISNAQAQYVPSRDAKTPTVDDIKRNAAFNRQLNANKAVGNLISIIQQLTANVNAAKNDLNIFQDQLTASQNANNDCNNKIFDLSNTRTKILNAIKDRQDKITEANKKISDLAPVIRDLTNARDGLVAKRNQIQSIRSPNAAKLVDLGNQLDECGRNQANVQKRIEDINKQIAGLNSDVKRAQDDAASAPGAIELINQQIPIVDAKIADLQKQIQDARNQKAKLLQDKMKYQQTIDDSARRVKDLQAQIDNLKNRIPDLQNQIASQQSRCGVFQKQLDDLRNQISQKQSDYKNLVDQINTQNGLINDRNDQVKKLQESIAGTPSEIVNLQQELLRVEQSIRRQYYICNDAADTVRKAQQNLNALNNKFNTQSGWLKEANTNLEKARAQKQLADQGVQEIIAASTSALPFAIVPNGNGVTPAGSPAGNNPSGSPLGPVADRNQVVPGSPVVVGDLGNYLSQAYGAGVDPTKPSTVTTLYPISGLTIQALTGQSTSGVFNPDGTFVSGGLVNGVNSVTTFPGTAAPVIGNGPYGGGRIPQDFLSSFSCSSGNGLTQGSGRIVSVQPGQIIVNQDNNNSVTLKVASCSNLNSVQPNFAIVPQTRVYYKGTRAGAGVVNLQQLTCV